MEKQMESIQEIYRDLTTIHTKICVLGTVDVKKLLYRPKKYVEEIDSLLEIMLRDFRNNVGSNNDDYECQKNEQLKIYSANLQRLQ